ncbi:MAG: sigma-54 dependent transcriptional regulator [Desulfobacteraceae bacterium]
MRSAIIISRTSADKVKFRSAFQSTVRLKTVPDVSSALGAIDQARYDMVFADLEDLIPHAEKRSPEDVIKDFKHRSTTVELVIMTHPENMHQAVQWVRAGAADLITYPLTREQIRHVTDALAASILKQSELDYLRTQFWKADAMDVVCTKSPAMAEAFRKIQSVAPTKTTVLLSGETGTGKTILAKLIHQHSNRQNAQFISVHCGAIPDTLIESELFGHEKGSFTGAVRKKMGKFELANGGTIFMDEVGTLTAPAQIKLLQVLQDGTFSRIGSEETARTNARVVAATNDDLKLLCEENRYRKDLYYRLNVFPIEIPPLRERIEDLPDLTQRFLDHLNLEFQKHIEGIHPEVLRALSNYDWPGNVRELENLVERAYILENTNMLTPESFPLELFDEEQTTALLPMDTQLSLGEARKQALEDFERQYLKALLARNSGKINLSAKEAGISTRQLHKLMRKYDLRKESFK